LATIAISLNQGRECRRKFPPVNKAFFVKAFAEDGIDEIVALISCVEATLMLSDERYTEKLLKRRYRRLVKDDQAYNFLKFAYTVRNKYLHALDDWHETTTLNDAAKCRWAVTKGADEYLPFADAKPEQDREGFSSRSTGKWKDGTAMAEAPMSRITLESGKRGGQPCVRGLRITVYDVLGWLASGMSEDRILSDHPDLERADIRACLSFAAERERRLVMSAA
jgi:uncharacterized protein (DUF433 family)